MKSPQKPNKIETPQWKEREEWRDQIAGAQYHTTPLLCFLERIYWLHSIKMRFYRRYRCCVPPLYSMWQEWMLEMTVMHVSGQLMQPSGIWKAEKQTTWFLHFLLLNRNCLSPQEQVQNVFKRVSFQPHFCSLFISDIFLSSSSLTFWIFSFFLSSCFITLKHATLSELYSMRWAEEQQGFWNVLNLEYCWYDVSSCFTWLNPQTKIIKYSGFANRFDFKCKSLCRLGIVWIIFNTSADMIPGFPESDPNPIFWILFTLTYKHVFLQKKPKPSNVKCCLNTFNNFA